jgi:hypothetical protein
MGGGVCNISFSNHSYIVFMASLFLLTIPISQIIWIQLHNSSWSVAKSVNNL